MKRNTRKYHYWQMEIFMRVQFVGLFGCIYARICDIGNSWRLSCGWVSRANEILCVWYMDMRWGALRFCPFSSTREMCCTVVYMCMRAAITGMSSLVKAIWFMLGLALQQFAISQVIDPFGGHASVTFLVIHYVFRQSRLETPIANSPHIANLNLSSSPWFFFLRFLKLMCI